MLCNIQDGEPDEEETEEQNVRQLKNKTTVTKTNI
jgi:hypothetical protein